MTGATIVPIENMEAGAVIDVEMDAPRRAGHVTFHLIHGTWPSGGWFSHRFNKDRDGIRWYQEGSRFSKILGNVTGSVIKTRFKWSGNNSFRARQLASNELREYLMSEIELHPEREHVIVAHSHGGNVALLALSKMGKAGEKVGLVTIATPFIHISRVPTIDGISNTDYWWSLFPVIPLFLLCAFGQVGVVLTATLTSLAAIVSLYIHTARKSNSKDLYRKYLQKYTRLKLPKKLLVIRCPGDETGTFFSIAEYISRYLYRVGLYGQRIGNNRWNLNGRINYKRSFYLCGVILNVILVLFFTRMSIHGIGYKICSWVCVLPLIMPFIASLPLALALDLNLILWIPMAHIEIDGLPPKKVVHAISISVKSFHIFRHSVNQSYRLVMPIARWIKGEI